MKKFPLNGMYSPTRKVEGVEIPGLSSSESSLARIHDCILTCSLNAVYLGCSGMLAKLDTLSVGMAFGEAPRLSGTIPTEM
jgi:hypothetical protein